MPPDPDEVLAALDDVAALVAATTVEAIVTALVEAACGITDSQRGMAGLRRGDTVSSTAWLDVDTGWTTLPQHWELGAGAPGHVCASAVPLICNDLPGDADSLPEATAVLHLESFACVPLLMEDGPAGGFLEVGNRERDYVHDDVQQLAALARIAAQRIRDVSGGSDELAREHSAQADVAERLQRRLLPDAAPDLPGLDVAYVYRSASTGVLSGGDFIDFYARSSGALAFAIGDVSGKGVEAMATTFVTKYILRAAVNGGQLSWPTQPGAALQELRIGLLEQPDFGADTERFVTVVFGVISTHRGTLQLASAGHPTPFLVRAEGAQRPLLLSEPAIGIELGAALAPYPTETIDLERGDVVVLFTDGLTELRDAQGRFFEDEMMSLLDAQHDRPAATIVADLMAAGEAFSTRPQGDDLAVLCIRLTAGRSDDGVG